MTAKPALLSAPGTELPSRATAVTSAVPSQVSFPLGGQQPSLSKARAEICAATCQAGAQVFDLSADSLRFDKLRARES